MDQVTDESSGHEHLTAAEVGGEEVIARGSARIVDRNPPNGRGCRRSRAGQPEARRLTACKPLHAGFEKQTGVRPLYFRAIE